MGLSYQKGVFYFFCPFLHKGSRDLPNFLHECREKQGPSFEPNEFPENILNPGLQRIFNCSKKCCFLLFCLFLRNDSKDPPNFFMSVENNRAHRFGTDVFSEKFLIPDYRGLSVVSKKGSFLLFCPFLHNGPKGLPNFCMSVEDNRAHRLSQMVFLKRILNPALQGIMFKKVFFYLFASSLKRLYGSS